jgi:hydroxymethylpyrimidine/phosphomethylpyrimidine kinase
MGMAITAPRVPVALTIAGSDSGGGAGIQADLKTFAALGVHGACVITALTAQNTAGVAGILDVPPAFVGDQIDAVVGDFAMHATKTGMLATPEVIEIVVAKVQQYGLTPLVVDPVLAATSGALLMREEAIAVLRERLLPLATIVTPNIPEAEALTGHPVDSLATMREAARRIHAFGPGSIVVKGGHLSDGDAVDVFFDGENLVELRRPRLDSQHTHGTGCTFASAIAAGLALGLALPSAVGRAKDVVTEAIRHGLPIGHGHGPVNSMAWLYERAGLLPGPDQYDAHSG